MIPSKKTIAVLHPYANKEWWAIKMMILLAGYLSLRNTVVFHTLVRDKRVFSKESKKFSWKTYSNSLWGKWTGFLLIAFWIRKCDFIIIWNSPMHFVWVLSKILFFSKAKIIWWNHHYPWYYEKNTSMCIGLKRYFEKKCIKKIDNVLANSLFLQQSIKKIWNIDSQILYPILSEDFVKNSKVHQNNKANLFAYGRWEKWKNIHLVFLTYEKLKGKVNNLTLTVWWDGTELDFYKTQYKDDTNVKIVWRLLSLRIIEHLRHSTLLLFPSSIDSFWLAKLESMSLWVPVISLENFYGEELVQDWKNGFRAKSHVDFREKSYEVLASPSLRKKLSLWAIETAQLHTFSSFESRLDEVFRF